MRFNLKINLVDPGKGHFLVSIMKSVLRFIASSLMVWSGYILWSANEYTDIFISDSGLYLMLAGIILFVAETLGILEELV